MSARAYTLVPLALGVAVLAACGSAQGRRTPTAARAARGAPAAAAANASESNGAGAASVPAAAPCAAAAPETLARTVGTVATRIYGNELASAEVNADRHQVESFSPLLQALAAGNRGAALAAVTTLVFSHTHIVRLRVTRGGSVIADVGGPEILAPVGGSLRLGGRTVGDYVLSVQDDSGYVKLVTRFIGAPLVLRAGSRSLATEGALSPAPARVPAHGSLTFRGTVYQTFAFAARAFPSGPLEISLLVPVRPSLAQRTCAEIRTDELGDVARRVSRRFSLEPSNLDAYIHATAPLTGGLIYIRGTGAGARQLAGSTQPGPRKLPLLGTVTYRGRTYSVFSFSAPSSVGELRIYQLIRP